MCGIAAIFAHADDAPPVRPEELIRIRDAMSARGPDGCGLWMAAGGRVGLGHRRLSIIDLSDAAHQPMSNDDGSLWVIFNGEIYNYRALRAALERKGCRFRSTSDTEVLLHLYADKGRAMVHELRGMYAFAIWDGRRQGLFAARDPFGIKPLYYADDGRTLRLASQVKALLRGGAIGTEPEPAGHVGFMLFGYVPEPYTFYKPIRELPSGSTIWAERGGTPRLETFCAIGEELARAGAEPQRAAADEREVRTRLAAALRDTAEHHLVADVPVGVFLSSGLDSTTLTALASELESEALHTVTLGFQEFRGTDDDETPLAERVAQHYATAHQTRWVSREEFHRSLDEIFEAMDQPSIDGVNSYFVSKAAAQAGLKVALSGLGGDELFGGYAGFHQIPRLVNAFRTVPPMFATAFRRVCAPIAKELTSPKYAGIFEYGRSYSDAYLLRRALFMPWELPDVLDAEMVREGWRELQPMVRLAEVDRLVGPVRPKISALEMTWYMRCQLLRDADWAGMAHSLEIRTPLVDIELLRAVAPMLGGSHAPGKREMAAAPARPLPPELLRRRKSGFTVPIHRWLLQMNGGATLERGLRGWARLVYASFAKDKTAVATWSASGPWAQT